MAAVLASGDGALLAGPAAAYLLGVMKGKPPAPEVATPGKRHVKGVKTRRSPGQDGTVWRGIPVTNVPRTLVDLAPYLPEDDLARACHEAGVRHHTTPAKVEAVLARRPSSPGAAKLRAILHGDVRVSLSELERVFLRHLRSEALELPETNRPAGGRRVDCRWPEQHLTVELDSYRYHHSRYAWEQDRRREREARARGDEFRRYTYGDMFEHPAAMLSELRVLLSQRLRTAAVPARSGRATRCRAPWPASGSPTRSGVAPARRAAVPPRPASARSRGIPGGRRRRHRPAPSCPPVVRRLDRHVPVPVLQAIGGRTEAGGGQDLARARRRCAAAPTAARARRRRSPPASPDSTPAAA